MTYETKINYELATNHSAGETGAVYGTGSTEGESINDALQVFSYMGKFPHQVLDMETKLIETKETI